jgi:hypothetical protein
MMDQMLPIFLSRVEQWDSKTYTQTKRATFHMGRALFCLALMLFQAYLLLHSTQPGKGHRFAMLSAHEEFL